MTQTKLTAAEIKDLRARLTEERGHLESQLTSIVEGSFAATQSDMAGDVGLDDESADAGTATFEREKDLSIENNVRDLLRKIDGALRRMDAKTYGLCERCGKPIEKARIKALPYAELCIKDAQAAQSRRRSRGRAAEPGGAGPLRHRPPRLRPRPRHEDRGGEIPAG